LGPSNLARAAPEKPQSTHCGWQLGFACDVTLQLTRTIDHRQAQHDKIIAHHLSLCILLLFQQHPPSMSAWCVLLQAMQHPRKYFKSYVLGFFPLFLMIVGDIAVWQNICDTTDHA
jgi:hypothetical protein